ncbi:glycosyltransferase [Pseudomonas shirazensis]|uniref:glycosyltransferase n=1 Tax=Pseudomonas shirazensis TaxID=2745494 RepID=UPI003D28CD3E
MIKISVITASYNRADLLADCIASVQRSKLTPLSNVAVEHIIYDDGSTDGTQLLMNSMSHDNLVFLTDPKNRGQSCARNRAIEKAQGDYLFILDSDDILLERALYQFSRLALHQPTCAWFTSDFLRVDSTLRYLHGHDYYGWQFDSCSAMLNSIFNGEHFLQGNTFFKREIFTQAGGYDDSLHMAEDLDLYIRFARAGHLPHHGNFISHLHRVHDRSISKHVTREKHLLDASALAHKYSTSSV